MLSEIELSVFMIMIYIFQLFFRNDFQKIMHNLLNIEIFYHQILILIHLINYSRATCFIQLKSQWRQGKSGDFDWRQEKSGNKKIKKRRVKMQ